MKKSVISYSSLPGGKISQLFMDILKSSMSESFMLDASLSSDWSQSSAMELLIELDADSILSSKNQRRKSFFKQQLRIFAFMRATAMQLQ